MKYEKISIIKRKSSPIHPTAKACGLSWASFRNGTLISSRPGVPGIKSLNAIAREHQGYAALLTENGSKISGFQWDISLYFNGKVVKEKKGIDAICITDEVNKLIQTNIQL